MNINWESKVKFQNFCNFLEKLSSEKDKVKKIRLFSLFLDDCRGLWQRETDDLFPVIRLLISYADRERGSFRIKETVLTKFYLEVLKLGSNSNDALKLKNWSFTRGTANSIKNDFASVLYDIIEERSYSSNPKFTIFDFNERLDEMVSGTQIGGDEGKTKVQNILTLMFRNMNAVEQKWTVRIILKHPNIGLGMSTILRSLHPDAKAYFDTNANLKRLCEVFKNPEIKVPPPQITLFQPFKPMLADRAQISKVEELMKHSQFLIEKKYDGERLQIHYSKNSSVKFKFYSRNSFDFSDDYSFFTESVLNGVFEEIESAIVDGEICAYDFINDVLMQKGQVVNIRSLKSDDPRYRQCFVIYDMILLNGVYLYSKPLSARINFIKNTFSRYILPGKFIFAENSMGSNKQDVVNALNVAIDNREEGIIVKDINGIYKPGARNSDCWIKFKPEYSEQLSDTLDLVILGGYYGSSSRPGLITHFLLGTKAESTGEYKTVTKVGSGYTYQELSGIVQSLETHFQDKPISEPDVTIIYGKSVKPSLYIHPKNSIVLQIKASEFVHTNSFSCGFTLRFPRVEKIRTDKSFDNCTTLEELEKMKIDGGGKLNVGVYDGDSDSSDGKLVKKRKITKSKHKVSKMLRANSELDNVRIKSTKLKGKVFVIEPTTSPGLKDSLSKIVASFGGTIDQNVSLKKTDAYIVTGYKARAKSIEKSKNFDMIKCSWLQDISANGFRPFGPSDAIFTLPETQKRFETNYDPLYQISLFSRSDLEGLKYSMSKVNIEEKSSSDILDKIAEFEAEHSINYSFGLFRRFKCFFPSDLSLQRAKACFTIHGGQTVDKELSEGVTAYVISPPEESEDFIKNMKELRTNYTKKFKIIKCQWIYDCIEKDPPIILSEDNYLL